jgi:hypothetical protein
MPQKRVKLPEGACSYYDLICDVENRPFLISGHILFCLKDLGLLANHHLVDSVFRVMERLTFVH